MAKIIAAIANIIGGAYLNRLRGSGQKFLRFMNKWWLALAYGLEQGFHVEHFIYTWAFDPLKALLCFGAMKTGYLVGWDVNAFYGQAPRDKNNFLDFFTPRAFRAHPKAQCTYRLSLRGLFWGVLLSLPILSPWPLVAGLMMGPVYFFGCYLCCVKYKLTDDGLKVAEPLFGAIMVFSAFV